MGFSFFPRTVKFFRLFEEQNRKLQRAAGHLCTLFEDGADTEEVCKQVNIIESEGNVISRNIARELSLTFITPLDREDIHDINVSQEDILNAIKAVSTRMEVYEPSRMRYPAKKLAQNIRGMVEESGKMLACLACNKTGETSMERIRWLKYESETLLLVGIGELYDCEVKDYGTILEIVKWSHIYDRIESAVDRVDTLGDILEGVMLKNA
ncbi:DUF47 family protein [Desulfovibrio sulfodismutans]|uniref:DUF47 family protein n=1 Tax=Desulfolutivibrio sulfodismutans TaxID=63561 RepID=A0A7K3NJR4_9BACT|nr:DUF47 family protein [Desulfolutivibrio sulfodismutans]NDY56438.1 DUF47 family protein [Desulfolutivibrio sulfodismutans]QLA13802.1 DUF47 family protein [Desulfolutivibrio sulfodismutans DSM 3696]